VRTVEDFGIGTVGTRRLSHMSILRTALQEDFCLCFEYIDLFFK
jgi:hypothetical protein